MPRTTILAAACLLLVLVAGGLLWMGTGPEEVGPPGPGGPGAGTASDAAAVHDALPTAAATAAAAGAGDVRVAVEAAAAGRPALRVRIVDEHGAAVAGADVAYDVTLKEYAAWRSAADAPATAPRVRSDDEGLVHFDPRLQRVYVMVRAGERYGAGMVENDDPLVPLPEVVIEPDRNVQVRVVSARGVPLANIPVQMQWQAGESLAGRGHRERVLQRTDAAGTIQLWHVQQTRFWDRTQRKIGLRPLVFGGEAPFVSVDLAVPPEPVTLVCPDHGALRVRGWLEANVPIPGAFQPWCVVGNAEWQSVFVLPGRSTAECLLHPIALGVACSVGAQQFPTVAVDELRVMGQELLVDLVAYPQACFARLQLLGPDGTPVAKQTVLAGGRRAEGWQTDAEGRVQVPLSTRSQRVSLRVAALHLSGQVELPKSQPAVARLVDLGSIRLQGMARIASGRLVSADNDAPLQGSISAVLPTNEPGRQTQVQASADEDGRFELWGDAKGTVSLHATAKRRAGAVVAVEVGANDVLIRLPAARQLQATLLVDAGIAVEDMGLRLSTGGEALAEGHGYERGPGRSTCRFDVPEGADFALDVLSAWEVEVLASVPMAQWPAVEGGWQVEIDLRGKLANLEVDITQAPADPELAGWLAAAGTECGLELGCLYARPVGTTLPVRDIWFDHHFVLAVNKTSVYEAVAERNGMCDQVVLRPGRNRVELPHPPVLRCTVAGLPTGGEQPSIEVLVLRLASQEPLQATLVREQVAEADAPQAMPTSPEACQEFEGWSEGRDYEGSAVVVVLPSRGNYVAMPTVDGRPVLAAAVVFEATPARTGVEVTLQLTPEQLQIRDR